MHSAKQAHTIIQNCLLSVYVCVCFLANVHIHPHADFSLSLGSQEHEAPPQTSACSQLPSRACGWASKLRLDQGPADSCSTGAQAGPSPGGSVYPTLTPTSGFDSALALRLIFIECFSMGQAPMLSILMYTIVFHLHKTPGKKYC